MLYLRSIVFFVLYMVITFILSALSVVMFWTPASWVLWIARIWSFLTLVFLKYICRLKVRIEGRGSLPSGHYIIASKHQSAWETVTYQYLFGPTNFMFKKELLFLPLFGFTLYKSGNVMVDRGATTRAGLQRLIAQFKRILTRRNMVVFPEGTRKAPGAQPDYKSGLAIIASQIPGAVIVPVAMNSGRFWGKNGFLKKPGTIILRIGKPIFVDKFKGDRQGLAAAIETGIESGMQGL